MPSYVLTDKCDGCKALDKTACQYVCPNDLMVLNDEIKKAYNQEPDMCWECYCCVKICPVQAIEVRGYADFVPMGALVTRRGTIFLGHYSGGRMEGGLSFPIGQNSGGVRYWEFTDSMGLTYATIFGYTTP